MKPRGPYTCIADNSGFKMGCLDQWFCKLVGCDIKMYNSKAEAHTKVQNTKSVDMLHFGSFSVGVGEFREGGIQYVWFCYHLQ